MADVWDGGTATVGIITYELNTDKTAIKFTRTDGEPWADETPVVMTKVIIDGLNRAAEQMAVMASELRVLDPVFAATLENQSAIYRAAASGEITPRSGRAGKAL